jgi:hypothetical protein
MVPADMRMTVVADDVMLCAIRLIDQTGDIAARSLAIVERECGKEFRLDRAGCESAAALLMAASTLILALASAARVQREALEAATAAAGSEGGNAAN